jgi:hypothetical protein
MSQSSTFPAGSTDRSTDQSLTLPEMRSSTPGCRLHWITGALAGMRNFETTQMRTEAKAGVKEVIDFAKIMDWKKVVYVPVEKVPRG